MVDDPLIGDNNFDSGLIIDHWPLEIDVLREALMREAVVVSAVRTAVGKAPRGILKDTRPDDVGAIVIREALARAPGLKMEEVDDIVLGCAFPESDQGLNLARV